MPPLTGTGSPVPLGNGYAIRAPGYRGNANLKQPRSAAERSRSRGPDDGTEALDEAFAKTDVTTVREVELSLTPGPAAPGQARVRSIERRDSVELQVPDLGPETGQLVLAADESGVLTWHLPVNEELKPETPATRGSGGVKRFVIPTETSAPPPGAETRTRSLLGAVGRKLLKVLVYPVTDPIVGPIGSLFAEKWETANRPYGLRDFSPANAKDPKAGALADPDWDRLSADRALLLIHGTFSTAHEAFSLLQTETLTALHQRYGGRVFAFNHFTLSHDPRANVEWLMAQIPKRTNLQVDIICHSRGGLVARTLAERPSVFGLDTKRIDVKRIVFVGVPNHGTLLANPDHMVAMIDRLTTVLNVFPTGFVTETLETLITALKVIGHGGLTGLSGLASMRPDGDFLKKVNVSMPTNGTEYFGVAANFEPAAHGLKALVSQMAADQLVDFVFEQAENDLVVPELGVYSENGSSSFPLQDGRLLRLPGTAGVAHTTMFGNLTVNAKLQEWLA
jgi:hypothetical protein